MELLGLLAMVFVDFIVFVVLAALLVIVFDVCATAAVDISAIAAIDPIRAFMALSSPRNWPAVSRLRLRTSHRRDGKVTRSSSNGLRKLCASLPRSLRSN